MRFARPSELNGAGGHTRTYTDEFIQPSAGER